MSCFLYPKLLLGEASARQLLNTSTCNVYFGGGGRGYIIIQLQREDATVLFRYKSCKYGSKSRNHDGKRRKRNFQDVLVREYFRYIPRMHSMPFGRMRTVKTLALL